VSTWLGVEHPVSWIPRFFGSGWSRSCSSYCALLAPFETKEAKQAGKQRAEEEDKDAAKKAEHDKEYNGDFFEANPKQANCPGRDDFLRLGYFGPLRDGAHYPKDHVYYEGYFHASATSDNIDSMNPRFLSPMSKPAAPLPLRAFLKRFKLLNEPILKPLFENLQVPFLTLDSAFADVAAQSHFGSPIEIAFNRFAGWHFDAPNSLLHLAISLHGTRQLHVTTGGEDPSVAYSVHEMTAGDVYLASPTAFMHAVSYPECDYASRVLALQCRILVDDRELKAAMSQGIDWDAKLAEIGAVLRMGQWRFPTYREVLETMDHLQSTEKSQS
jgi:hypothetical protein